MPHHAQQRCNSWVNLRLGFLGFLRLPSTLLPWEKVFFSVCVFTPIDTFLQLLILSVPVGSVWDSSTALWSFNWQRKWTHPDPQTVPLLFIFSSPQWWARHVLAFLGVSFLVFSHSESRVNEIHYSFLPSFSCFFFPLVMLGMGPKSSCFHVTTGRRQKHG